MTKMTREIPLEDLVKTGLEPGVKDRIEESSVRLISRGDSEGGIFLVDIDERLDKDLDDFVEEMEEEVAEYFERSIKEAMATEVICVGIGCENVCMPRL